jgi:hypothetical protein
MNTRCPSPDLKQTLTLTGHGVPLEKHHHQEADLISRTAIFGALVLALLGFVAAPALAASPGTYRDPKGRFVLAVPPDTQVTKKGDGRQGYRITLQTSPANAAVSLSDMAGKLEARHLGPLKVWNVKLGERLTNFGGLPAREMVYEGSKTRIRVFIMRGKKTDFVFMFFAAPRIFDEMTPNFDWVLRNFQLTTDELPSVQAAPEPTPPQDNAPAVRRFTDRALGYAIDYPGDWMMERPTAFSTVFSGRQGTEAYYATVRIQNVKPQTASGPKQAMVGVLGDLKAKLAAGARDLTYLAEGPFLYDRQGVRLDGRQFMVAYINEGQRFRQWTIVMPRSSGTVTHIWSYASQDLHFDAFRSIAEKMLRSWILDVAPAAQARK